MVCYCAATERAALRPYGARGAALSWKGRPETFSAFARRGGTCTSWRETTIVRWYSGLRLLHFDEDHAICGSAAVHRDARGVLEDFDGRDIVWVDARQA